MKYIAKEIWGELKRIIAALVEIVKAALTLTTWAIVALLLPFSIFVRITQLDIAYRYYFTKYYERGFTDPKNVENMLNNLRTRRGMNRLEYKLERRWGYKIIKRYRRQQQLLKSKLR